MAGKQCEKGLLSHIHKTETPTQEMPIIMPMIIAPGNGRANLHFRTLHLFYFIREGRRLFQSPVLNALVQC